MGSGEGQNSSRLQHMLQSAVKAVQWTYSLFWQFCPQQGMIVWGEGYYNGGIKTRKTVHPREISPEEASLERSQQLRELYDSLSAGESNQQPPARRPCAALSPEDLTETEWFYLMCVSFSFPPGIGLPGKAYAKNQHVWLTGANEVDSKVFSRAILAKSACIQTVVCIPLMDGVVELGFTERVQEYPSFIQQVRTFFIDHHHYHERLHNRRNPPPAPPPKPALSEHSTSNPTTSSSGGSHLHAPPLPATAGLPPSAIKMAEDDEEEEDDDEEEEEEEEEEEGDLELDSEADTGRAKSGLEGGPAGPVLTEPSELMQVEMSEDIRLGSPEDASNNLDSVAGPVMTQLETPSQLGVDSFRDAESTRRWPVMHPQNESLLISDGLQVPTSGAPSLEELTPEDTHYSQTVSIILQFQSTTVGSTSPISLPYLSFSPNTAFSRWISRPSDHHHHHLPLEGTSQWFIKYVLFTVPYLHAKCRSLDVTSHKLSARIRPGNEISGNHVLAERRRREKLNERFIILRSLVPFVTKMDKASILGDTIEYVKQLRKKIQDLEAHARQMEIERVKLVEAAKKSNNGGVDKRKVIVVEKTNKNMQSLLPFSMADLVQVSIIENDALVELQCPYKEGLLLDVMNTLKEMHVEVTTVQSSLDNGSFKAEIRAKVKETINGKKASIVEVKRAINHILPHTPTQF